ncbi:polysaccharide biosynthesis protein [candidate division KSB1 bacterium]|nr:polysaccharide biosynthesis protein [candidate division KSB1 bacterium]
MGRKIITFIDMKLRNTSKIALDVLLIAASYYAAYLLRFDGDIPQWYKNVFINSLPFVVVVYLALLLTFGVYRGVYRYSSIRDLGAIFFADTTGFLLLLFILFEAQIMLVPRSVLFIFWLLVLVCIGGVRFVHRAVTVYLPMLRKARKKLLIVGAGNAGEMVIRQITGDPTLGYKPVGIVDDSSKLQNSMIHGVSVIGRIGDIENIVRQREVDEILIATPSATAPQMRRIVHFCEKSGARFKTLPGPRELMNGQVSVNKIRDVRIEDLLERTPVDADCHQLKSSFFNRAVLVTGAAGSIGSELCRQLKEFKPRKLIMLDRAESDLYDLAHELTADSGSHSNIKCVLADITQKSKLEHIFLQERPDIIFHAAAYKHVPFMEEHPEEAVLNNVMGTINVSEAAAKAKASRFVLISTDKAVNPSSVMGATKRLAEYYCVSRNGSTGLVHCAVRFGNVLASKGSVIPLFQQQIANGGPVTVTSKKITRYFMTIPEAVTLVMQAGCMGSGGEIFILDMGEPLNVYDMARHLISLSGLELGKDIEIKVIGLRPGEKLYEELWHSDERPIPTGHPKILKSSHISVSHNFNEHTLGELKIAARCNDRHGILYWLSEMIPNSSLKQLVDN